MGLKISVVVNIVVLQDWTHHELSYSVNKMYKTSVHSIPKGGSA